ncbi:universal stress protein [Thiococcus pfennigii]|nr:universal stress protein [Thiococcus pfennigii]MBK1730249.1 universal stress protein [Thiococcus pfennigii]
MKRFADILCVIGSPVRDGLVLARAVSLAENNQARLTVAALLPVVPAGSAGAAPDPAVTGDARRILARLTEPYRQRIEIRHAVLVGTGFLEVIRAVLREGHDLVIKAAEDPSFLDRLFGSDDMHLLRKCPCPVWLTKPGERPNYARILAAVDIEPPTPEAELAPLNRRILELAGSLALSDFAELHLAHAWDVPEERFVRTWSENPHVDGPAYVEGERRYHQDGLDRLGERLRGLIGAEAFAYLVPQLHLCRGPASLVIPDLARQLQADLVVMGTLSRTGVAGLFIGNTAEAILEQLTCSVLAIKPPGFVSPVA